MHRRQVVDYLVLAGVWGASFVLVLRVVQAFGWVGAVAFRALTASVILTVIAVVTRRRLAFGSWRPLAAVGATTVAGQLVGLSVATPLIGTAMAAIFVAAIPLFSMVIGQLWGIERITAGGRAGLLLGFFGVVLLVGFPAVPVTGALRAGVRRLAARGRVVRRLRQQLREAPPAGGRLLGADDRRVLLRRGAHAAAAPRGAGAPGARAARLREPGRAGVHVQRARVRPVLPAGRGGGRDGRDQRRVPGHGGRGGSSARCCWASGSPPAQLLGGAVIISGCCLVLELVPWRRPAP